MCHRTASADPKKWRYSSIRRKPASVVRDFSRLAGKNPEETPSMHEELYVCFEMTRCSELHTRGASPLPEGVPPRAPGALGCALSLLQHPPLLKHRSTRCRRSAFLRRRGGTFQEGHEPGTSGLPILSLRSELSKRTAGRLGDRLRHEGAVGLALVGRDDGLRVTQLSRQLAWLLLRRQSGR